MSVRVKSIPERYMGFEWKFGTNCKYRNFGTNKQVKPTRTCLLYIKVLTIRKGHITIYSCKCMIRVDWTIIVLTILSSYFVRSSSMNHFHTRGKDTGINACIQQCTQATGYVLNAIVTRGFPSFQWIYLVSYIKHRYFRELKVRYCNTIPKRTSMILPRKKCLFNTS